MSPLLVKVTKKDGTLAILSAQQGKTEIMMTKDIVIMERNKLYPKDAKLGIEVGQYRSACVAESKFVVTCITGGEFRPLNKIYVSFYGCVKAALEDFCSTNEYNMIDNMTERRKKK